MENQNITCPECGSTEIMRGDIRSTGGCTFIPEGQNGLKLKSAFISANACKKCGAVFGLRLMDKPNKLTD